MSTPRHTGSGRFSRLFCGAVVLAMLGFAGAGFALGSFLNRPVTTPATAAPSQAGARKHVDAQVATAMDLRPQIRAAIEQAAVQSVADLDDYLESLEARARLRKK